MRCLDIPGELRTSGLHQPQQLSSTALRSSAATCRRPFFNIKLQRCTEATRTRLCCAALTASRPKSAAEDGASTRTVSVDDNAIYSSQGQVSIFLRLYKLLLHVCSAGEPAKEAHKIFDEVVITVRSAPPLLRFQTCMLSPDHTIYLSVSASTFACRGGFLPQGKQLASGGSQQVSKGVHEWYRLMTIGEGW